MSSDSESDREEAVGPGGETPTAEDVSSRMSELNIADVASTSVTSSNEIAEASVPWRSALSKVDIWYASYGSNMCLARFLCYIRGGKVKIHIAYTKHDIYIFFNTCTVIFLHLCSTIIVPTIMV